jgi:hypothetical protein
VLLAVVGFCAVPHATPRAVTALPPSALTVPPAVAVVPVMLVTFCVVSTGMVPPPPDGGAGAGSGLSFLQADRIKRAAAGSRRNRRMFIILLCLRVIPMLGEARGRWSRYQVGLCRICIISISKASDREAILLTAEVPDNSSVVVDQLAEPGDISTGLRRTPPHTEGAKAVGYRTENAGAAR